MSSFFNKLKAKVTAKRKSSSGPAAQDQPVTGNSEPTFSIQPHPAVSSLVVHGCTLSITQQ